MIERVFSMISDSLRSALSRRTGHFGLLLLAAFALFTLVPVPTLATNLTLVYGNSTPIDDDTLSRVECPNGGFVRDCYCVNRKDSNTSEVLCDGVRLEKSNNIYACNAFVILPTIASVYNMSARALCDSTPVVAPPIVISNHINVTANLGGFNLGTGTKVVATCPPNSTLLNCFCYSQFGICKIGIVGDAVTSSNQTACTVSLIQPSIRFGIPNGLYEAVVATGTCAPDPPPSLGQCVSGTKRSPYVCVNGEWIAYDIIFLPGTKGTINETVSVLGSIIVNQSSVVISSPTISVANSIVVTGGDLNLTQSVITIDGKLDVTDSQIALNPQRENDTRLSIGGCVNLRGNSTLNLTFNVDDVSGKNYSIADTPCYVGGFNRIAFQTPVGPGCDLAVGLSYKASELHVEMAMFDPCLFTPTASASTFGPQNFYFFILSLFALVCAIC